MGKPVAFDGNTFCTWLTRFALLRQHLGYGLNKYTPSSRGFEHFLGSYEVGGDHFAHTVGPDTHALGQLFTITEGHQQTLDLHRERGAATGASGHASTTRTAHEFVTTERGVYSSELFAREAVAQIERVAAANAANPESYTPLFLYLAFTTIHTPLQVGKQARASSAYVCLYVRLNDLCCCRRCCRCRSQRTITIMRYRSTQCM